MLLGQGNWKTKFATRRDLWKYGPILTIQKTLTIKWLNFSKKRFLIWVYHFIIHSILNPSNKFETWINIKFSILWCFSETTNLYFLTSKVHYFGQMIFLSINNHIILFIIKLLIYIQVPISRSKDILITICIWMKGSQEHLLQKWAFQPCIYPKIN
jgi:hypothetical protein